MCEGWHVPVFPALLLEVRGVARTPILDPSLYTGGARGGMGPEGLL
jgi:hypothetical protein